MRLAAMAAAMILTTACSDDGDDAADGPTGVAQSCDGTSSAPDPFDTFMTLAAPSPTVAFELSIEPDVVCAGDTVQFVMQVQNRSDEAVEIYPDLVVTEPLPHVVLVRLDPFTLDAGEERTVEGHAVVALTPGRYDVFVRGYDSTKAALTVRAA